MTRTRLDNKRYLLYVKQKAKEISEQALPPEQLSSIVEQITRQSGRIIEFNHKGGHLIGEEEMNLVSEAFTDLFIATHISLAKYKEKNHS